VTRDKSVGLSRRSLLLGSAAFLGSTVLRTSADAVTMASGDENVPVADPTRVLGRLPSPLGQRSSFEQPRRILRSPAHSGSSRTPLHMLNGVVTPADLHFERHHAGVPDIDPNNYKLLIHGMVGRPMVFTLADLKRLPATTRVCFIECSGNGDIGFDRSDVPTKVTPGQIDGLFSTSEWTGVALSTLFREVGVDERAAWFLAEGGDAALVTRSIPTAKAWDDAMIVYAQNGEAIRPEQGYPARLLLPGWEGATQIKWIRRIELADEPFMTREETSHYTDPLGDGTARMFSFEMDAKSIITFPAYPSSLTGKGWWEIRGMAWSGRGVITRVDVSSDLGKSWQPAELQHPILPKCNTRFRLPWNWNGRETYLMSRAVDSTGYVQPTLHQLVEARGAGTLYHTNHIRPWRIDRSGEVYFGLADLI